MVKKILIFYVSIILYNCKGQVEKEVNKEGVKKNFVAVSQKINPEDIKTISVEEAKTFYKATECKYEYRTGKYNEYKYNYNVKGYDKEGNQVTGNIDIEGKYGAGIIMTVKKEEINIQVEWIGYGKLQAVDDKGNEYELEVE
ncbi:hypothetical protein V3Q90_02270 [Flavobacterium oreochromis]|uniref:Lipoprotein n=1 Tax=Flavobacterium oreochromis TaxID=2906078 RepID=A0ABW8P7W1_9FLAO|nr:hypothetical protein [Flavobacterium oreochromis]